MYTPPAFSVSDHEAALRFLRENSFGILVSRDGETLHDTHTPFLVADDLGTLRGHIARANPQWKSWAENPRVKVIFHGPHAYISPSHYKSEYNVPTWNYTAISIDGRIRIIEDHAATLELIQNLVVQYEGENGWQLDSTDERNLKLLHAVVAFEIEVDHVETKFKLNQNKSPEDRAGVIASLLASNNPTDRATAEMMRRILP